MAYFNHAFTKRFLGTQVTGAGAGQNPNVNMTNGFITVAGIPSSALGNTVGAPNTIYGPGSYGFFDPKTYQSVDLTFASNNACCPLVLASGSLLANDKIGPFHGGYKESNKSKIINPKYISKAYVVEECAPQQSVTSIGNTPYTQTLAPADPLCCKEFLCDETYYLRIDVKGSPALRYLNHQAYQTVMAYTGCCTGPTPTPVDSTLVMIQWAQAIVQNQYLTPFLFPIVYDEAGTAWFPPNSTVDPQGNPITPAQWWSAYVSPGHTANACAGLRLFGAYVETKFGNCSFQLTDFFEKEPVLIYASLVDYNGDPCVFEGLCVYQECRGLQGMGFGEQVVRDLILSESYLQNFFATDIRIREITQGDQILNSVNRNALYTRYFILHNVPRLNNPTGVFDNDQYMLEIISTGRNAALETFLTTWLGNCANCVTLDVYDCTPCNVVPI